MGVHFSACLMLARTKGVFKVSANQVRYFRGLGVPQKGFFLWREAPPLGTLAPLQPSKPPTRAGPPSWGSAGFLRAASA